MSQLLIKALWRRVLGESETRSLEAEVQKQREIGVRAGVLGPRFYSCM